MSENETVTDAGSWDDVIPQGGATNAEWELRAYSREIRRSCPKCGAVGEKNWNIRWTRALKVRIPAIPGECLRVSCVRCGWWFFMETQEQAEKRGHKAGPLPVDPLGPAAMSYLAAPPGGRTGPPTQERIRGRIKQITDMEGQRLIDRVLELVDDDGRLAGTWQADLQSMLREALSCPLIGDERSILRRTGERRPKVRTVETLHDIAV